MKLILLTRDVFSQSHFELGSGTTLQPLLRFSDRCSEFLFVDFNPSSDQEQDRFAAAVDELRRAAHHQRMASPLELQGCSVFHDLAEERFELAYSSAEVMRRLLALLEPHERRGYAEFAAEAREEGARQWLLEARFARRIRHVVGPDEVRPLTLRLVGGEGLLTYLAMGGEERPPPSVGTVQTGLGEAHFGPVARLFARQAARGGPLPKVWVRGRYAVRRNERILSLAPAPRPLEPAAPFSHIGQSYAAWRADRVWPDAPSRRREVKAWLAHVSPLTPLALGPHRLVPAPLTAELVRAAGAACLPIRLAEALEVRDRPHVYAVPRTEGELLRPLADAIRAWQDTPAFHGARDAVLVPYGYEDELSVVVRWLSALPRPAVTVYLPMPLDFGSARLALR